jgi:acetyl esterase/lipase
MITPTRRGLIGGGIALMTAGAAARVMAQPPQGADETIPLWPGTPPGGEGVHLVEKSSDQSHDPAHHDRWLTQIGTPMLVVKRAAKPNGVAVMSVPGGGYGFLSYDNEGIEQAAWLNARGITTFILLYRLPGEGWMQRADVPLQDAQRAMRLIRANADRYGIRSDRIAVLGFSAGGHLAGSLATRFDDKIYDPVDAADRLSARPDLAGLIYPVITLGREAHVGSRDALLGPASTPEQRRAYSVQNAVSEGTPPVFLCCAGDDGTVPPANSILMYQAMLAAGRPAELHAFAKGGHGFGVRLPTAMPASHWPDLFMRFAAAQNVAT